MILKYRSHNKNWCYVEGRSVVSAIVNNPKGIGPNEPCAKLSIEDFVKRMKETNELIEKETGMIPMIGIGDLCDSQLIACVSIDNTVYALAVDAYLINDNGKVIEKLF